MQSTAPALYTVHEVAERLRVKPKTIRRWIANKELLATKPKGTKSWRIPESALKQLVNEGANIA